MKTHVFSDTHLDHYSAKQRKAFFTKLKAKVAEDKPELAIIAGDVCGWYTAQFSILELAIKDFSKLYKNVIFVLGNHDYWSSTFDEVSAKIKMLFSASFPNVHFFHPTGSVTIDGIKFGGGTLWYADPHNPLMNFIDLSRVLDAPESIYAAHEEFLKLNLEEFDVIVSHHMPIAECVAPKWQNYHNNYFFCSYLERHLSTFKKLPRLWVMGHSHTPLDFVSSFGFRCYLNAFGYENEGENPDFWDRLLVEI